MGAAPGAQVQSSFTWMVCWGGPGEATPGPHNFLALPLRNEADGVGEPPSLTLATEPARHMPTAVPSLLCVNNRTWRLPWMSGQNSGQAAMQQALLKHRNEALRRTRRPCLILPGQPGPTSQSWHILTEPRRTHRDAGQGLQAEVSGSEGRVREEGPAKIRVPGSNREGLRQPA